MAKMQYLKSNAGTTLVELMIAVAIFSSGMVLLSGSVITFSSHNVMSEQKAQSTTFGNSVLEDIRSLGIEEIVNYDVPVDDPDVGTVYIPGMGDAYVTVYANATDPGTQLESWYVLGQSVFPDTNTLPNPIEIKVELVDANTGYGERSQAHYSVSSLVSY